MEKTQTLSRKAAEQFALNSEIETVTKCVAENDFDYVKDVFEQGFKGYMNFTNEELEKELEAQYGHAFKIVFDEKI